jgi:hypothetical protein
MKNINVDIRYADGRIFQCPQPTLKEARELAHRLWSGRGQGALPRMSPEMAITGVMVTRWNGDNTVVSVTHGEAFTY